MPSREPNNVNQRTHVCPEVPQLDYDAVNFQVNPAVSVEAVCNLRTAVDWDGSEEDYPAAFAGYWGTIGAFDGASNLIGWCAILSDGVRHAVLLDVIVHPTWQRQGIGRQIVNQAINHIQTHGISIVHVDFRVEYAGFYRACGFRIGMGGIMNT